MATIDRNEGVTHRSSGQEPFLSLRASDHHSETSIGLKSARFLPYTAAKCDGCSFVPFHPSREADDRLLYYCQGCKHYLCEPCARGKIKESSDYHKADHLLKPYCPSLHFDVPDTLSTPNLGTSTSGDVDDDDVADLIKHKSFLPPQSHETQDIRCFLPVYASRFRVTANMQVSSDPYEGPDVMDRVGGFFSSKSQSLGNIAICGRSWSVNSPTSTFMPGDGTAQLIDWAIPLSASGKTTHNVKLGHVSVGRGNNCLELSFQDRAHDPDSDEDEAPFEWKIRDIILTPDLAPKHLATRGELLQADQESRKEKQEQMQDRQDKMKEMQEKRDAKNKEQEAKKPGTGLENQFGNIALGSGFLASQQQGAEPQAAASHNANGRPGKAAPHRHSQGHHTSPPYHQKTFKTTPPSPSTQFLTPMSTANANANHGAWPEHSNKHNNNFYHHTASPGSSPQKHKFAQPPSPSVSPSHNRFAEPPTPSAHSPPHHRFTQQQQQQQQQQQWPPAPPSPRLHPKDHHLSPNHPPSRPRSRSHEHLSGADGGFNAHAHANERERDHVNKAHNRMSFPPSNTNRSKVGSGKKVKGAHAGAGASTSADARKRMHMQQMQHHGLGGGHRSGGTGGGGMAMGMGMGMGMGKNRRMRRKAR
ncbi:MAG: hypothetical protein Q9160_008527 [Pyrenula sp. 1 TL-2023]